MGKRFDEQLEEAKKRLPCSHCGNKYLATETAKTDLSLGAGAIETKWTCSVCGYALISKDFI